MGIKVKDALKLDIFKNTKVIAGEKGLDRIIHRVSVFDCPVEVNRDRIVLKEGDFFVSNFYPFKDDENYALSSLEFINSCGCSCFCITNEYVNSFTNNLIDLCNRLNFPVITIDYTTSYGDIMNEIMGLILDNQRNLILEMKIDSLLHELLPINKIKSTLSYINHYFLKFVTCIYCYSNDNDYVFNINLLNLLNKNKNTSCINYKDGLLIIISYDNISISNLNNILNYYIDELKSNVKDYVIGVSENYIENINSSRAIKQSLICTHTYKVSNNTLIKYQLLGSFSFLVPLKDYYEIKTFYNSLSIPILNYDEKNNTNLFKTLICFVENNGDYKLTSSHLFQHENTIRYKISKIKSLLNMESLNIEFYEKISLLVKLNKIYNNL